MDSRKSKVLLVVSSAKVAYEDNVSLPNIIIAHKTHTLCDSYSQNLGFALQYNRLLRFIRTVWECYPNVETNLIPMWARNIVYASLKFLPADSDQVRLGKCNQPQWL